MKLINCYIQNFGKLKDFSFEFQDGINKIKQDNGFGKTTFASFIKSMFYGLDKQTNIKSEKSERKKYMPWQGGIFGGSIEFEINNKKYRIERTFGKKSSEDTFKLFHRQRWQPPHPLRSFTSTFPPWSELDRNVWKTGPFSSGS